MVYRMQDVLRSVEAMPPPPSRTTTDDIIGRARRSQIWRNVALGSGVAACLAVVVTVPALALTGPDMGGAQPAAQPAQQQSSAPPPATPTDPPLPVKKVAFRTDLAGYRIGEFQVGPPAYVTAGYTELPVYRDGVVGLMSTPQGTSPTMLPVEIATITVYAKDVYDTATFGGAGNATLAIGQRYPMSIEGRQAWTRDWVYTSPVNPKKKMTMAALAWQHADGAWATLVPNFNSLDLSREQATKIATGLTTRTPVDLKVPYRLSYLPANWQAVAVRQNPAANRNLISQVFLHQGPVADPAARIDDVLPGNLQISLMKGLGAGKAESIKKEGVHCTPGKATCAVIHGDYRIDLYGYGGTLSDTEIKKIADGLQLGDLAHQNTWYKVDF
ncbi:hypothetical protein AFR_29540 [Actinoplanes friuliensis DSM 7358]|uniref:Uncharacterized protein n=2 Tax=Actinoplanes friuliensis TaxID=196914 RepID=U5W4W6_9ACTN|nr:hypothetical protein AFR_29540 [Actinoplanes friuliensis DSM 7358]